MKNIITVQHTQSQHHTNGMIGSWMDWDLSEKGVRQAQNIAASLPAAIAGKEWHMYASDLLRARHTAEIIGEAMGIEPVITQTLRERNLGRAVGKSVEWFRENMQRQERTVYDRFFDDAESRKDVWDRLQPFVDELLKTKEDNIILVSHGDTLSIFNALWLGMEVGDLNHCDLFGMAGGVSFFQVNDDGKRIIRRLSDLSFIADNNI